MSHVLGIDAGGSKTLALLADGSDRILLRSQGPGANLQIHGEARVEQVLTEVLEPLRRNVSIDAVCLGMAGTGRPGDRHLAEALLKRLGFACPLRVVNDAFVALVAGVPDGCGIVVVSGTGSLAFGVDANGNEARSGGWGHLLGDEGSAYWLGHAAVRRGIRAADGRGDETVLGPRILKHLELGQASDLVSWFYDQDSSRERVAELAPIVEQAAAQGDQSANELLDEAALHLARAARSVAGQLSFEGEFSVVPAGGAFRGCPSLKLRLEQALDLQGAVVVPWVEDPALGAVRIAWQLLQPGDEGQAPISGMSSSPSAASDRGERSLNGPEPSSKWADLSTEAYHPDASALDSLAAVDVVTLLLNEDRHGLGHALKRRAEIARLAGWAAEVLEDEGRVIFLGAGTSGRLGVLEAAECPPTFGSSPGSIQGRMAGGRGAVFEAVEGAEDSSEGGAEAVEDAGAGDLVVGISASSVTPFVIGGLTTASAAGARTALITCASREGLEDIAGLVVALDTGPEVLAGSTRLKAGSATKAVLNAVTTAAMIRLGKVYGSWMVDLRPGSKKLVDRSVRIVASACDTTMEQAECLLEVAEGSVKLAIVIGRTGSSRELAEDGLSRAGGRVRAALELLGADREQKT